MSVISSPASAPRLRRIYILFNAKHDLNDYDLGMLANLSDKLINAEGRQPFTLQAIITKVDSIPSGKEGETIRKYVSSMCF